MRPAAILLIAGLAAPALTASAGEAARRFRVDADLRPLGQSADGRFALDATARFTPAATSMNGRYTLKAVKAPTAGCDPFLDPMFADGFELP